MSGTETLPAPQSYSDIATIHGRRLLLYREFGSYQGEWLMLALGADNEYAIYKGWYGSCSGCDDLQSSFSYEDDVTAKTVREWADQYRPFALVPAETATNLVKSRSLATVFPANLREFGEGGNLDEFAEEAELVIALEEGLPLVREDALRSRNQETRRRIFEKIGVQDVITEVRATEKDGPDRLVRVVDGGTYLHLHDPSTDREYLLRVPPETQTVREGKAWTFTIPPHEYAPLLET